MAELVVVAAALEVADADVDSAVGADADAADADWAACVHMAEAGP